MEPGHSPLIAWLRERIRATGPIPFHDFMEAALYHQQHGYYCRPGRTTGPDGDFYTSSDLHPAFGLLVSRQIAEMAERASCDDTVPFHLIEAGPGSGRLARDIVAGLALERPALARRTHLTLVEVSPSLREAQKTTLDAAGVSDRVAMVRWATWAEVIERRLEGMKPFAGCVVANELIDAMPVHVVEMRDGALMEAHVTVEGDELREVLLEPSTGRLEPQLDALAREGVALEEGQRAEIGLRGLDWVSSLGALFGEEGRGGAILIDYGHPARELYSTARHRGTLMCYRGHLALDDPYRHVGEQDLTAHVDLTSLVRRAREAGLDAAEPVTQMRFLVALGLARMLADLAGGTGAREARERLALHGLMAPGGMGEVFKVILMTHGAPAGALTGAQDPFR